MINELKALIDEQVNPILAQHNGGCEVVSVQNGTAHIKLTGSCTSCPGKKFTFEKHITPYLLQNIEGLKEIKLA